jgi:hypothetical protein
MGSPEPYSSLLEIFRRPSSSLDRCRGSPVGARIRSLPAHPAFVLLDFWVLLPQSFPTSGGIGAGFNYGIGFIRGVSVDVHR